MSVQRELSRGDGRFSYDAHKHGMYAFVLLGTRGSTNHIIVCTPAPQGIQQDSPATAPAGSGGSSAMPPSRPGSSFSGFLEDFLYQHQHQDHTGVHSLPSVQAAVGPELKAMEQQQRNQGMSALPCFPSQQQPGRLHSNMALHQRQQQSTLTRAHFGVLDNNVRIHQQPGVFCNSGRRYFK